MAFGLMLVVFLICVPFIWKSLPVRLLQSSEVSSFYKNLIVQFYQPLSPREIRQNAQLYNGGFRTQHLTPGRVLLPGKGFNYLDTLGLFLTADFFAFARPFENGFGVVNLHGKWGALNRRGRWVVPPMYDNIYVEDHFFILQRGAAFGCADFRGRVTVPLVYETIKPIVKNGHSLFYVHTLSNKAAFGIISRLGKEQEPPCYDSLDVRDGYAFVRKEGRWGALNQMGERVVPELYQQIAFYDSVYFSVRNAGKMGLHKRGQEVAIVPTQYDTVAVCTPTTYMVGVADRYGLLDKEAVPLFSTIYDTLYAHHAPEWIVVGDSKGYALRSTRHLADSIVYYQSIAPICEGMTLVVRDGLYGVLSDACLEVIEPQYDSIATYSDGVAVVFHKGEYGTVDKKGQFLIPFSLNLVDIRSFHNGRAVAAQFNMMTPRIRKQYGFIDKQGRTLVPFVYSSEQEAIEANL